MHFLTVNIFLTFLRMNFWECAQRRSGNGCNVYSKTELTKQNQKTKLTEFEYNILDVSNLAKKTTTIENKIPDVSSLVKKTDYNTKVTEIENKLNDHNHDKYIDTQEFNTLAALFKSRLAQANLTTKAHFDAKLSSLNRKNYSK